MQIVKSIAEARQAIQSARRSGKNVGFVPTMGALHAGHTRLIELCRDSADFPVVSIFVNPTQFGPREDFANYPRTWKEDRVACEHAGAELIFVPDANEIYPRGSESTVVEVPRLSSILEGASRPTHFRGVATVVLKLLNIVQPDLVWFGLKDYQQTLVIRRMIADLNLLVDIRLGETLREPDGLAMSSRNRYLNPQERSAAAVLYRALSQACETTAQGERDADRVRQILRNQIESEPLARLDYAEIADAETLESLTRLGEGRRGVALIAARVGPTRLIDNVLLPASPVNES